MKAFLTNPLIVKEMRERFRTKKTFWILAVYLFVMGAILIGFLHINPAKSDALGENRELFIATALIQYAMICFIAPALPAGAISGERERQTLQVLLTTQLSPASIIYSKLITTLAFLFLLVIASLPLYSFVFLYGGMSPEQLLQLVLFFAVNIVFFGSLGLFCSTWIKRTGVSTITAYGIAFFVVVGTGLLLIFLGELLRELDPKQFIARDVWSLTGMRLLAGSNPVFVLFTILGQEIGPDIQFLMTPWAFFSLCYLALSFVLTIWSAYLLAPVRRIRRSWK